MSTKNISINFEKLINFIEKKYRWIIVIAMIWFLVVSILNAANDSATYDEIAHIPAAYSYLTEHDMRLNPEHPPLIKDLAGLPLVFMDINFDTTSDFWTKDNVADSQWNAGRSMLYASGNNPDKILFWSRIPIILLSALLGLFVFKWSKELAGISAGLIALVLYTFDPNILGHNHYVTTDIGIAVFIAFSFYYFLKFIKKPSWKNAFIGGFFLGLVNIAKFSSVLLLPIFALVLIGYPLIRKIPRSIKAKNLFRKRLQLLQKYILKGVFAFVVSMLIVWITYIPHTYNMPAEEITKGINHYFSPDDPNIKTIYTRKVLLAMNENELLKPMAEYTFGLTRVFQRVAGGNQTYFLQKVSSDASPIYFPTVFAIKEPLPLLILIAIALSFSGFKIIRTAIRLKFNLRKMWDKILHFCRLRTIEATLIGFIVFYSLLSITGNLNIGIRHLFPIFPFIYILLAKKIVDYFVAIKKSQSKYKSKILTASKYILAVLLLWFIAEPILAYPYYMSYFNQTVGGPKNGYHYVTDSNADWGQDLKRLKKFLDENPGIDKIRVNYFGGGNPEYLLGEKYIPWWDSRRPLEPGWYAISVNFLQESIYDTRLKTDGTPRKPDSESWRWVQNLKPTHQIGTSIFIYYLEK